MRKIAAIFFLSVLCFNCIGYRYVFDYLGSRHTRQFEANIDENNYDEGSLISIKTSFSLPYLYASSDKFERWKGEIVIDGVSYTYVKRRFFNDSIELLCLPNMAVNRLKEAQKDFFRATNDLQAGREKKQDGGQVPVFKNLLSEYCEQVPEWNLAIATLTYTHQSFYGWFISPYAGDSPGQPPDPA